jgi:hypothetical protein
MIWPTPSGLNPIAACSTARVWSRSSHQWRGMNGRPFAIFAEACSCCSKLRANMRLPASVSTLRRSTVQGLYAAMYKPFHLIGLELSISVLNAVLRGQPTGTPLARRCCCRRQEKLEARRHSGWRRRIYRLRRTRTGVPAARRGSVAHRARAG